MARKKYTRGNKSSDNDFVGIVLVIISAFFLLCICIPVILGFISRAVRHVTVGVFGFMAYPMFLSMFMLGIALIQKRKLRVMPKTVVGICIIVFLASIILQMATSHAYLGNGIGGYISGVYNNFTAGGVFFGVFAYGIQSVITPVFTYIVCSLGILLTAGLMLKGKLGIGKSKSDDDGYIEKRFEFKKGVNAPQKVTRLADTTLFVDTIQPVGAPIETNYGSFTQLNEERPAPSVQNYSMPVAQSSDDSGFISYHPEKEENKYADKKARAMDLLYGGTDNFQLSPTSGSSSPSGYSSAANYGSSSSASPLTGIIPPHVFGTPDIRKQETKTEPTSQKPPKILHIQDIPELKSIPQLPDKDLSGDYVGGNIINGDMRSQEIAGESTPLTQDGQAVGRSFADSLPKIDNFDTRKAEPPQVSQRKTYNFTNSFTDSEPVSEPDIPSAPIVNGDYFNRIEPVKQTFDRPEPKPVTDNPPRLSDEDAEFEKKFNGFFGEKKQEPKVEQQETVSDFTDDEVEDLSEKSFDNPNDYTGYYNELPAQPDFSQPIEFKVHKTEKEKPQKLKPENQIKLDEYVQSVADPIPPKPKKRRQKYNPPPLELLSSVPSAFDEGADDSTEKARMLEETLRGLKLPATVSAITRGPTVTRYELEMPPGIPVKHIERYAKDIEYSLAIKGHIRIETPIPGKRAVGIEVPNNVVDIVSLRDVLNSKEFTNASSPLTVALGKDITGANIICALDKTPHLLVAGTTGTGKSVCLNSIIISLLYKSSPEDVRIILIDPKQVEFTVYKSMPHLLGGEIITDPQQAFNAFKYLKKKMDERYSLFSKHVVHNIQEYNKLEQVKNGEEEKLPYIVLIVDELAELFLSANNRKELEDKIMSMAQKARAAGIHLILATQRPSVDVITGTIKANLPSRIAFAVKTVIDSRTILDDSGAEALVGRGDMLYAPIGAEDPRRVQGSFIDEKEVPLVVEYVRENNPADFDEEFLQALVVKEEVDDSAGDSEGESEFDPLMQNVLRLVIETGTASTSFIQRRFAVGYARASRIMDQMQLHKFIGPLEGAKPRQIFISREQYREMFGEEI